MVMFSLFGDFLVDYNIMKNFGIYIKKTLITLIIIVSNLVVSKSLIASNDFDQLRPSAVSDAKWSSLKGVVDEIKLLPSPEGLGAASDQFGYAVSLSGNRALVGAYLDDDAGVNSGSAYIFDFDGENWIETQKFTASDGTNQDRFGISVSLSGDRALIGTDNNTAVPSFGSAYVYDFDGVSWNETQKLTASDGEDDDQFGFSVSLSGGRALIGAFLDDDSGNASGSAYVYDFDGISWSETQKLTAGDGAVGDQFGFSVSLSGDRALIAANFDDDVSIGLGSGSAYVFDFNGVGWVETQKLTPSDGVVMGNFGVSVSLSGDKALIGADRGNTLRSGVAYVFEFNGINWSEKQKLTPNDASRDDFFGFSVSLTDKFALIGAYGNDDAGSSSGSAYVFEFDGFSWSEQQKITASDGAILHRFGYSVSMTDRWMLIGSPLDDDRGINSGSAYVIPASYNLLINVSGLAATNSVSFSNANDNIDFNSDGTQIISLLFNANDFDVGITAQPDTPNQVCNFVNANSGIIAGEDYTIEVVCITVQYAIGGTLSGLDIGNEVVLQNNAGDDLTLTANGSFSFMTLLDDGSDYEVTVLAQPSVPNQICQVKQGDSELNGEDVNDVNIICVTEVYSIGGSVTGLSTDNSVTLALNGDLEYLVVDDNQSFSFVNDLLDGSNYEVEISSNSANQRCSIANGKGIFMGVNVTDIEVSCKVPQFFVGGFVAGLIDDNFMVLQLNMGNDLTIIEEGAFVFMSPLNNTDKYDVSIAIDANNPIQPCELFNASGNIEANDVNNIFITCAFGEDLIYRHGFDGTEAIMRLDDEIYD